MNLGRTATLCVALLFAGAVLAEEPEAVARRFVQIAYDGPLDRLPRASTAHFEKFEQQVRNLRRVRCVRVESIAVRVGDDGVYADVAIVKSELGTPHVIPSVSEGSGGVGGAPPAPPDPSLTLGMTKRWSATDIVPLRLMLASEGGRWLVADVQNRDDELAAQVVSADAEKREQLLEGNITKGLARALYRRAMASLNNAAFKQAIDIATVARRVATEAGDAGGVALALGAESYGFTYQDIHRATMLSEEELALAQQLGDPDVLARAWYDRGRNGHGSRWAERNPATDFDQAACYRKSIDYAERAEDPALLTRPLYSLANLAANGQADYLAARRLIDRGIAIARECGDTVAEGGFETVLATIYFNQGDPERGLFHNARAMKLSEKENAFSYAALLVRSAYALVDLGRFEEARKEFARILTRNEAGLPVVMRPVPGPVISSALRAMAIIEAESGNLGEAECLNRQAAPYHGGGPDAYLYELSKYRSQRGDHQTALAFALASLAVGPGLRVNQRVAASIAAGRAYRSLGMPERGLALAQEAIDIREELDPRVAGDERQRAIASNVTSECYELAAELALDEDDPLAALRFLERGRARVLIDILEHGRPDALAEEDAAVHERLVALDREVAQIDDELARAVTAKKVRLAAELRGRLDRARTVRASFLDGVQARSDRRERILQPIDPSQLLAHAARLPRATVAVEYFLRDHALDIFVVDGTPRVTRRTKRIERSAVEREVKDFLQMLAAGDLRVDAASRRVHDLLIAPIENDIAGAHALVVVPDELLWRVPFAALVDGEGRHLIERSAIVYAPSLTAFSAIAGRHSQRPPSLLAIANPTRDPNATQAAASFYRDATLGPLPDAEHEVDALGRLYDRNRSLVLKRDRATEGRTRAALHDATIAHFATHAILDDANPMYSRLLLARGDEAGEDGWLESWEVARLDLDADLVVLSACETARGTAGGGEGVVGLSWSFLLAGARSIVATQWKVASNSTAEFMIAFHRFLRAAKADPALQKAESVREAQLLLLRNERTRHPFHWAPFVLLGDPGMR